MTRGALSPCWRPCWRLAGSNWSTCAWLTTAISILWKVGGWLGGTYSGRVGTADACAAWLRCEPIDAHGVQQVELERPPLPCPSLPPVPRAVLPNLPGLTSLFLATRWVGPRRALIAARCSNLQVCWVLTGQLDVAARRRWIDGRREGSCSALQRSPLRVLPGIPLHRLPCYHHPHHPAAPHRPAPPRPTPHCTTPPLHHVSQELVIGRFGAGRLPPLPAGSLAQLTRLRSVGRVGFTRQLSFGMLAEWTHADRAGEASHILGNSPPPACLQDYQQQHPSGI